MANLPRLLAENEFRGRVGKQRLTSERLKQLIYDITGDINEANRQEAWFVLDELKAKSHERQTTPVG